MGLIYKYQTGNKYKFDPSTVKHKTSDVQKVLNTQQEGWNKAEAVKAKLYAKYKAEGLSHNDAIDKVEYETGKKEPKEPDMLKEYTPQNPIAKFAEIAANPFTALREKTRHGRVPDYLNKNTDNEMYSPTSVADMLWQSTVGAPAAIASSALNVAPALADGDYIGAGLNALDALPVLSKLSLKKTNKLISKVDNKQKLLNEINSTEIEKANLIQGNNRIKYEAAQNKIPTKVSGIEKSAAIADNKSRYIDKPENPDYLNDFKLVEKNTAQPWKIQELPGLHLKSTMEGQAISKIIEPKTGLINVEQALGIIGKESGGADKVALIKKGLGEKVTQKMDYNEFRKTVQDQLIPLETKINPTGRSEYGLQHIGYDDAPPMELQALTFSNKNKFGRGSGAHGNPDETLGHVHFLRDVETPDVLTVTQIQSDAFQGTNRTMPKNINESIQKVNKLKEEGKEIKNLFSDGKESSNSVLANYEKHLQLDETTTKNFAQKQLLDKNHQERYLQELVNYAGKRGDLNKIRLPTSETAAKVQGYKPNSKWNITPNEGDEVVLLDGTKGTVVDDMFVNAVGIKTEDGKVINIDVSDINYGESKQHPLKSINNTTVKEQGLFASEQQTILRKYSEQPKAIKKIFGVEPTIVTDGKGNTWYEFDIPKKFKQGKGEIKAFTAPAAIGTAVGAAALTEQKRLGGKLLYKK